METLYRDLSAIPEVTDGRHEGAYYRSKVLLYNDGAYAFTTTTTNAYDFRDNKRRE